MLQFGAYQTSWPRNHHIKFVLGYPTSPAYQ